MSIQKVKNYLKNWGLDDQILQFDISSATVVLAAQALHCEQERIAKTLSFKINDTPLLIVTAGDMKIDNSKYKSTFGCKAKMLSPDEVENLIGHAVGGVCPFGINDGVSVYLDISLKRFTSVFPACGSSNSAIELTPFQLEKCCPACKWVDVCKNIQDM